MVRNRYVKIEHNGKDYIKKNNILDAYPEHIAKRQLGTLDTTDTGIYQTDNQFELSTLLLKLDTPLQGLDEMGENKLSITGEDLEGSLEIINNGDNSLTLNGDLPEIEGTMVTGESFTITDADSKKEARIKELQGNTTQEGTPTPTTPIPIYTVSGDNEVVVCGKNLLNNTATTQTINGVTFTVHEDKSVTVNGTATAHIVLYLGSQTIPAGTYTLSGCPKNGAWSTYSLGYGNYNDSGNGNTFTLTSSLTTNPYIRIGNGTTVNNLTFYPQIELGTVATQYSPYVSNPIQLNKIGNRVDFGGTQLFNINATPSRVGGSTTYSLNSGVLNVSGNWYVAYQVNVKENTDYFISADREIISGTGSGNISIYNSAVTSVIKNGGTSNFTFNSGNNTVISVVLYAGTGSAGEVNFSNIMLNIGTTEKRYSPYVSNPIELCKIGSYVDKLKRAEGKNLYKGYDNLEEGFIPPSGSYPTTHSSFPNARYQIIDINAGDSVTIGGITPNSNGRIRLINATTNLAEGAVQDGNFTTYSSTANYSGSMNPGTITAKTNIKIGVMWLSNVDADIPTFMINYGSTALPYEPYGNNWYIEKNIGKVVLNGSENWAKRTDIPTTTTSCFRTDYSTEVSANMVNGTIVLSNMFTCLNNTTDVEHFRYIGAVNYRLQLFINKSRLSSDDATGLKTWLQTNNTTVYYVLATPTYEIITNENLIEQLNNLQNIQMQDGKTNIFWTGEVAPEMTLQYNFESKYEYDLGVQDFVLNNGKHYEITSNGLNMILKNNDTVIYSGSGIYTPNTDLEVTNASIVIPRGKEFQTTIYPVVAVQSGLVTTDFDFHYIDTLGMDEDAYKCLVDTTQNGCIAKYFYTFDQASRFRSYANGNIYNYESLNGRKITAIGFACNWIGGGSYQSNREVLAVLDTSNYSLILNKNVPLNISRVDEITSDAIFYTEDFEIKGPVHLDPLGLQSLKRQEIYDDSYTFFRQGLAKLVGVYVSNYFTNEGSQVANSFTRDGSTINVSEVNLQENSGTVFPKQSMYLSNKKYLQNSGNKYLLYKYKIYQPLLITAEQVTTTFQDTGLVYYMATKIPHYDNIDLKIKYERS